MKTLFKYISSIFFSICLVLFFAILILFAKELRDVPDITQANLQDPLSSEIYDKNLNLIATVGAEKREYVSINDIPKNITDAVLSTEDSRFQSHIGIDPIRLIKAALVNIRSNSAQQGASTITQQVVKNSLLTSDKSLQRKIQEAYLSLKLENRYSKDDILEMYMNKIYYSDGQYGIKTAAKYFYNKELNQLTLPQIALLTGMPQQPILYNPYDYPEQAKERRNTVLYALLNNDKITEAEYNNAINTPIMDGIVEKTKEIYELWEKELKGKKTNRPRILITGCPVGGVREKILTRIEEAGADIVVYENCSGVREKLELIDETIENPIEAIAKKYLNLSCSVMTPNEKRFKDLDTLIDEYQVDAVIEIVLQACHTFAVESTKVKKFVTEKKGKPYMYIESDYSMTDVGQVSTRIEAFLEMI